MSLHVARIALVWFLNSVCALDQPFGRIAWKENGNDHECDGVLLGDVQVLTVYECLPQAATQVTFTQVGTNVKRKVTDAYHVSGKRFVVLKLANPGINGPYAVLSWFGAPQATMSYNLKQETVLSPSLKFSGTWIDHSKCSFASDSSRWFALSCTSVQSARRLGGAFYKHLPSYWQDYVVFGLISKIKDIKLPKKRVSLEAWRMKREDIKNIMSAVIEVKKPIPQGIDFIPSYATIGSFNIQGFSALKRDMANDVLATWFNIFKEADIVCVQETADIAGFPKLQEGLNANKLLFEPSKGKAAGLGFVFNKDKVTASKCRLLQDSAKNVVTYACNFKFKQNSNPLSFVIFNLHLKAGDTKANLQRRQKQIQDLKKLIKQDTTQQKIGVYLIAGDMNTKDPNEMKSLINQFPEMRIHEPGQTTPAGRHYDRILVQDNLRLTHYFRNAPTEVNLDKVDRQFHRFFPVLTNGRVTPKYRNFQLSDHLPLYYEEPTTKVKFGTWNMQHKLDSTTNPIHKYYTGIFGMFDVIALQEINQNSAVGQPGKEFGRQWELSGVVTKERLAFAYDAGKFNSPVCGELEVKDRVTKGVAKKERNIYWCKFPIKNSQWTILLANVHILNPGQLNIAQKYKDTVITKFQNDPQAADMKVFMLGDYNMDVPAASRSKICRHAVDNHGDWTFTMADSKHVRDYIWDVTVASPGVTGCKVLNPELLKVDGSTYLIESVKSKGPMKTFGRWKEISDHYPIFMYFEGWTAGKGKRKACSLSDPIIKKKAKC